MTTRLVGLRGRTGRGRRDRWRRGCGPRQRGGSVPASPAVWVGHRTGDLLRGQRQQRGDPPGGGRGCIRSQTREQVEVVDEAETGLMGFEPIQELLPQGLVRLALGQRGDEHRLGGSGFQVPFQCLPSQPGMAFHQGWYRFLSGMVSLRHQARAVLGIGRSRQPDGQPQGIGLEPRLPVEQIECPP